MLEINTLLIRQQDGLGLNRIFQGCGCLYPFSQGFANVNRVCVGFLPQPLVSSPQSNNTQVMNINCKIVHDCGHLTLKA